MKNGALEAEIVRLDEIICNFCDFQRFSADIWQEQKHIAPLFDIAKKEATRGNEAKPPEDKS